MRWVSCFLGLMAIGGVIHAEEKRIGLTAKEAAEGWLMLFDGETTFGWATDGPAKVKDGFLWLGYEKEKGATAETLAAFTSFDYILEFSDNYAGEVRLGEMRLLALPLNGLRRGTYKVGEGQKPGPVVIAVNRGGAGFTIRRFLVRPTGLQPLFNGKDLSGWKKYQGDNKRDKSKFTVTPEGWLSLKNGPGDLQTEAQFDDFVLQLECISNGKGLNSGIFFRTLPGEYQNGYEAQIQNGFKDGDRTKPTDFGTGAIYRRKPARRVVPNDGEWFTMTVLARGNQLLTWVNGYPTCDFKDERPPNENARNGRKTGKGAISIQGHDPTTDLSFRNIRIGELK